MEPYTARARAARESSQVLIRNARILLASSQRTIEGARALDAYHQQQIDAARDLAATLATRAGLDPSDWLNKLERRSNERSPDNGS